MINSSAPGHLPRELLGPASPPGSVSPPGPVSRLGQVSRSAHALSDRVVPPPEWLPRLVHRLGGLDPAYFARHRPDPSRRGRAAAVLMLFGPRADGAVDVVLTQRTSHLRSHAGQVSFPGGRIDPHDDGPVDAALREANEEVGLDPRGVRVLGAFPELFLSASSSSVTPVLAWWERPAPIYVRSPAEVERVVRVGLADLLEPTNRFMAVHPNGFTAPAFEAHGLFIWGFTAALLTSTLDLAELDGTDWDRGVAREVPYQRGGAPGQRPQASGEAR